MAVVQISRIQLRRGKKNESGLPQLASGELAWAIDTQELYIGNGAVSEGAPAVGNTKVLTENDSILDLAESYQYKFDDSTVQTSTDPTNPVIRSLQKRLDEGRVNSSSFGIEGTMTQLGATVDYTAALQNAIFSLYLSSDPTNAVELEFDPGYYKLTGTVYIPSNVKLVGTGKDSTRFFFVKGGINTGTSLALAGTSVTTAGTYTNISATTLSGDGVGAVVTVTKTGTGATYTSSNTTVTIVNSGSGFAAGNQIKILGNTLGGSSPANDLTITLSDGQTGEYDYPTFNTDTVFEFINDRSDRSKRNETPTTNLLQPRNILMKGFTVSVAQNNVRVFNFADVIDSEFVNVKAVGTWVHANGLVDNSIALEMVAKTSLVTCQRNKFEDFEVQGFTYAVYSNTDIINNSFSHCYFKTLYRGISFGEGAGLTAFGPRKNTISDSIFEGISREGILVDKGYGNRSENNNYVNVGNNQGGNANNVYGQIKFTVSGNTSSQDNFDRAIDLAQANFAEAYVPEIIGHVNFVNSAPTTIAVSYSPTVTAAMRLPLNTSSGFEVDYVYQSTAYPQMRKGKMHLAVDKTNNNIQLVDEYEYVGETDGDSNVIFQAQLVTTSGVETVVIYYKNTNLDDVSTLTYTLSSIS